MPALASQEEAAFLAFLGTLEDEQEADLTPLDWEWLLDDISAPSPSGSVIEPKEEKANE
ncbi:hypothetical protein [Simiduia agarivorans]|nr:hypothetical protein [Simiduia agarivorans]